MIRPSIKIIGNPRGTAGEDAYVYIAYASDSSGTGFTMTFNASLNYIAVKNTTSAISSPQASDFTGLWKLYKGQDGIQWQGTYAGGTSYVVDDVVYYDGSSYICTLASTGNLPTDTGHWDIMSQKSGNNSTITSENPSGDINGSNQTYILANTPLNLSLYLNGQRLTYTTDYTLSAATITMVIAPLTGDILRADYLLAGAATTNADTLDNLHASDLVATTTTDAAEATTPADANLFSIIVGGVLKRVTWANIKATLKSYFDTLYGTSGSGAGWISLGACTYEGADAPTFTFSLASDMTGILSAGMRINLTQTTVKYFIITAVGAYSGGKTIITVYGGTDYTLANASITIPYYSIQKAPFGFPLDPTKWTVEVTDVTIRSQAPPSAAAWYNLGSVAISMPIGVWDTHFEASIQLNTGGTATSGCDLFMTLSTANNSESDVDLTTHSNVNITTASGGSGGGYLFRKKVLVIAAKTSYYLNSKVTQTIASSTLYNRGDNSKTIIRAICAYL